MGWSVFGPALRFKVLASTTASAGKVGVDVAVAVGDALAVWVAVGVGVSVGTGVGVGVAPVQAAARHDAKAVATMQASRAGRVGDDARGAPGRRVWAKRNVGMGRQW